MFKRKFLGQDSPLLDTLELNDSNDSTNEVEDELIKAEKQERTAKAIESIEKLLNASEKYSSVWKKRFKTLNSIGNNKHRKAWHAISKDNTDFTNIKYFTGSLRPYQIEGVQWMRTLFLGGINGILADEMGLGKTIQVIALFSYFLTQKSSGPHLIVGPLSTVSNWKNEFKRFCPKFPVVVFYGTAQERRKLKDEICKVYQVDNFRVKPVIITNYQTVIKEKLFLAKIDWRYIVVDEAQSIKNHNSRLAVALRNFQSSNKLLLTGTPLQNNMTELWALLNFIMPQIFQNVDTFSSIFVLEDMKDKHIMSDLSRSNTLIATIHKVLAPFMLRRLKADVLDDFVPKKEVFVYCPMSETQRNIYTSVIKRNVNQIKNIEESAEEILPGAKRRCSKKVHLCYINQDELPTDENCSNDEEIADKMMFKYNITFQNPMMMFRKVVNHPYLISTPIVPGTMEILITDELIKESGKMLVLDAMLHKLKASGHKVLIFSTLVIMLDLVEEYMLLKGLTYRRLNGSIKLDKRQESIDEFNNDPNILAFLISTRAGGLGINLTGADTVIFIDRDWNPQADCQAQDRCHRIGQTKPVMIYTLVTKNTIDESVINCGEMKRRLEKLIIKDGVFRTSTREDACESLVQDLLKLLESKFMSNVIHPNGFIFSDEELEKLLDRSELYKEMENRKNNNC